MSCEVCRIVRKRLCEPSVGSGEGKSRRCGLEPGCCVCVKSRAGAWAASVFPKQTRPVSSLKAQKQTWKAGLERATE